VTRTTRGAKGTAPIILLGTEQRPSGAVVSKWRAPSGHYMQYVHKPGPVDEAALAHAKQFIATHQKGR
jgi:hypothetical protein